VRSDAQWRSQFFHLAMRRGRKIAKVAMARKLAVELYWMWRRGPLLAAVVAGFGAVIVGGTWFLIRALQEHRASQDQFR